MVLLAAVGARRKLAHRGPLLRRESTYRLGPNRVSVANPSPPSRVPCPGSPFRIPLPRFTAS
eukprot:52118-Chlamydomonas_euryale.AAC.1